MIADPGDVLLTVGILFGVGSTWSLAVIKPKFEFTHRMGWEGYLATISLVQFAFWIGLFLCMAVNW